MFPNLFLIYRERNKVFARKTRQKKKEASETLQDRLIALLVENRKLRLELEAVVSSSAIIPLTTSSSSETASDSPSSSNNDVTMSVNTIASSMKTQKVIMPIEIPSTVLHLPDNIEKLVQSMLSLHVRWTWKDLMAKQRSFCLVDAKHPNQPITYVSQGFSVLTGYEPNECIGRNCKFLQGPETDTQEVLLMREALQLQMDFTAILLNYKKDGTPFWNQIEIAHLRDMNQDIRFIIGVQNEVRISYFFFLLIFFLMIFFSTV
jgi:PAS domain S-box-containing protein